MGLAADIRDFGAAISHVADGKDGAWFELGASIVGFVPGGDIAKGIAKGVTKGTAKATAKIGQELVQEVAKVAKASTAKVVDDVADIERGAMKARKGTPRGPPSNVSTLQPGPFATESIPARNQGRSFSNNETKEINRIGADSGCHTCGSTSPTTQSGNFVRDHQPPNALSASDTPQRLYPQCVGCSRKQGGEVNAARVRRIPKE